ncbi:protein kinase family protein [Radiobacillus deserti]|uniref:hypothetical protein n=1 Tax=Radiobacillus deserti TaxID=2594883 RepID=UPI001E64B23E|nr:hypothetical protein [Radiobacillus deserti]
MIHNHPFNGDNSFKSCLSSFLEENGKLSTSTIQQWKENVFYVADMDRKGFVLKAYEDKKTPIQQWRFFMKNQSPVIQPFCAFPNGEKILRWKKKYWTIQTCLVGEKLTFEDERDRRDAVDTVKIFHKDIKSIQIKNPTIRVDYEQKCRLRLRKFWTTKETFERFGFSYLFHEITQATSMLIRQWSSYRSIIEGEKKDWIHGDLAAHNFIRIKEGKVRLIDFDLLGKASTSYDYMQLGQRFLEHIHYDIPQLLTYKLCSEYQIRPYLIGVAIPMDHMREWLHFIGKLPMNDTVFSYLSELERSWSDRKQFIHEVLTYW